MQGLGGWKAHCNVMVLAFMTLGTSTLPLLQRFSFPWEEYESARVRKVHSGLRRSASFQMAR